MSNGDVLNRELLYRDFGIAVAAERRRKHLSQHQFGIKVGLSRTSVTNVECGRQPVQLHQIYLFASVLGVGLAKLLPEQSAIQREVTTSETDEKNSRYLAGIVKAFDKPKNGSQ